jgi:serralysin
VSAQATTLTVGAAARSATLTYGDVDWYRFTAQAGLTYRIRTYGNSDTYLRLYAQNTTTLLAENDDDVSFNAGITWTAPSGGTYYFTVRGYGDSEQGSYSVNVTDVSGQLLKASASSGGSKKSPGRLLFHKMAGLKSP